MFEYIYIDDTGIEIALDNKFKERTCYLRRVPIPNLGPLHVSRKSDKCDTNIIFLNGFTVCNQG